MIDKQKYAKILLTVGTNCLNCGWLEYLHKDTLAYEFFGQYSCNKVGHRDPIPIRQICPSWKIPEKGEQPVG